MRYKDLFCEDSDYLFDLKTFLVDQLTALKAQGIEKIGLDQFLNELKENGYELEKDSLIDLLDPNNMKIVNKIENEIIFIQGDKELPKRTVDNSQERKDDRKISSMAKKSLKRKISDKGPL